MIGVAGGAGASDRERRNQTEKAGSTMRRTAVILPDLGTGPDVPIVISYWFATPGDIVWEGERLVEVLAGPATFDVPAPASGRLVVIHGREDDRVEPGAVLGVVAADEEGGDDPANAGDPEGGQLGPGDRDGGGPRPRRPTP